jgi:hypothetical protein
MLSSAKGCNAVARQNVEASVEVLRRLHTNDSAVSPGTRAPPLKAPVELVNALTAAHLFDELLPA